MWGPMQPVRWLHEEAGFAGHAYTNDTSSGPADVGLAVVVVALLARRLGDVRVGPVMSQSSSSSSINGRTHKQVLLVMPVYGSGGRTARASVRSSDAPGLQQGRTIQIQVRLAGHGSEPGAFVGGMVCPLGRGGGASGCPSGQGGGRVHMRWVAEVRGGAKGTGRGMGGPGTIRRGERGCWHGL